MYIGIMAMKKDQAMYIRIMAMERPPHPTTIQTVWKAAFWVIGRESLAFCVSTRVRPFIGLVPGRATQYPHYRVT